MLASSSSILDRLPHALAESTLLPGGARVMLLALAGILFVLLGAVVALAVALRRRQDRDDRARRVDGDAEPAGDPGDSRAPSRARLACPGCRREYEPGLRFCPRDARALLPASEVAESGRTGGAHCPRCRRSFESGLRFCPFDAADLVPAAVYETTRADGDDDDEPSGVIGRICPRCRRCYDLVASFCGRDGSELEVIN